MINGMVFEISKDKIGMSGLYTGVIRVPFAGNFASSVDVIVR